jgi:cytochrome c peroxidase
MKKLITLAFGVAAIWGLALSCKPENNNTLTYESDSLKLPAQELNYALPTKGEAAGITFRDNKANAITNAGATLGRVLFYDKKLSLNNQVACASCHLQEKAFADDKQFSVGFQGMKTTRNASTLTNENLNSSFFWDMRTHSLEDLSLQPVRNHIEMGIEDMDKLSVKLTKVPYYADLFEKAYGAKDINGEKISKAMAQFLRSMVTYRSRFDEIKKNNFAGFTTQEAQGMELFTKKLHCTNCHGGDNFNEAASGEEGFNIGLDKEYADNGVGKLTGDKTKNGIFKVPSLRNIALTAPYMHDGRFNSLDEVVNHYNFVKDHENLMPSLRSFTWQGNGGGLNSGGSIGWGGTSGSGQSFVRSLNLSTTDKQNLVAFLHTLTDDKLTKDERFSSPFKN